MQPGRLSLALVTDNATVPADRLKAVFEPLFTQPGVTHLGRIGHARVAAEYRAAGIWAYPCSFPETSCISAMKAQAAGAIPVVIPSGALRETIHIGFATKDAYTDPEPRPDGPELVAQWRQGHRQLVPDSAVADVPDPVAS